MTKGYKKPKKEEIWVAHNGEGNRLLQSVIYNDLKILWGEQNYSHAPLSFILNNKEIIHDMLEMLINEENSQEEKE